MPTDYPCFKGNVLAPWEQQNGAVSPMTSSSRCYRILHSSSAFQEHAAKFPHSPLFVPLSCRCTALGLAPGPVFECQLALREEADFSQGRCSAPHPRVPGCARTARVLSGRSGLLSTRSFFSTGLTGSELSLSLL